ncbi:tetratricopeptide repeat protein [Pyxidicoccus fallax]|uniref:Tetratricopeptide repeat protein n=1 Tax=Pyxidicoccus fallax TaxID=394095 RepID=A0A848LFA3_9BACT|nr:tetratricopeptide repeat protein [Pyxidicoccus fallax]NMO15575.1 tetratricopeptide repeat protein [Pyxidicoccus fallax]NPC81056.1 tetratricopeptide repeat protein [Pyxidicoccus fallax]
MRHIIWVGLLGLITACAAGRAEQGGTRAAAEPSSFATSAVTVMQAYDLDSRFGDAASLGRFAIERTRLLKDTPGEARLQVELGRVLSRQLRHEPGVDEAEVVAILQRARQLAEASNHPGVLAAALDAEGMYHYFNKLLAGRGEWAPIVALFERSAALAEQAGDSRGLSEALFHLGLTQQFQGNAVRAREVYERSLAVARGAGDALMQSYNLRHLAGLAEKRGDLDTALAQHRECLRLREQVGFHTGQIFALIAVAHVLTLREPQGDEALPTAQRALRMAEERKDPAATRESLAMLGRVHLRRGDGASALPHLEQAMANAESHQDWLSLVEMLLDSARAHALRGEKAHVETQVRRAFSLATGKGLTVVLGDVEQLGREHGIALR